MHDNELNKWGEIYGYICI